MPGTDARLAPARPDVRPVSRSTYDARCPGVSVKGPVMVAVTRAPDWFV
jgi:hypothetical protein